MSNIKFINIKTGKFFTVEFGERGSTSADFKIIVPLFVNLNQKIQDIKINRDEIVNQISAAIGWVASQPINVPKKSIIPKEIIFNFAQPSRLIHALSSLINDVQQGKLVFNENDRTSYNQLLNYFNCQKFIKINKPVKDLPSSYIALERLMEKSTNINVAMSTHKTKMVEKLDGKNTNPFKAKTSGFFKDTAFSPGKIPEIEAATAAGYRTFLGYDHAPKTKAVFDNNHLRRGVFSEGIKGFISFDDSLKKEYEQQKLHLTINAKDINEQLLLDFFTYIYNLDYSALVDKGIIEMLVASYFFEENDLHGGNWGFDYLGHIVRIDFDQSLWSLTSKYANFSEAMDLKLYGAPKPRDAFVINENDLREFPALSFCKPINWIFSRYLLLQTFSLLGEHFNLQAKLISDLKKHPDFDKRKWTAFLKLIILPSELIMNIYSKFLGNKKSATKYALHLQNRINQLRDTLVGMPEFQGFLRNYGNNAIVEIINNIKKYNEDEAISKQLKTSKLQFKLDDVETNYKLIMYAINMRQNNFYHC